METPSLSRGVKIAARIRRPPTRNIPHTLTGDVRFHRRFKSALLPKARDIAVYLPPDYSTSRKRRYPVLYLHDGQNLFDGATSFVPGQEWRVDETADWLIREGAIEPLIIVGIYNTGADRLAEYTPTVGPTGSRYTGGGKAAQYARLLVEEIKPFIDLRYRTAPDQANTGLGGSSLGGLVSLYIGAAHPHVFSKLALVSPSIWWDRRVILRQLSSLAGKQQQRIWLDMGTDEGGPELIEDARRLRDLLIDKGWVLDEDLKYFEVQGGRHSEASWAERVDPLLRFLFPRRA